MLFVVKYRLQTTNSITEEQRTTTNNFNHNCTPPYTVIKNTCVCDVILLHTQQQTGHSYTHVITKHPIPFAGIN